MLVLIDESLPRQLVAELTGHDVRTVSSMGWRGKRNGELLRQAVGSGFGALITADRNLEFQQHIPRYALGVIVLMVPTTKLEDVLPFAPNILEALKQVEPGRVFHIGANTRRGRG